jgi:hypothetical protein
MAYIDREKAIEHIETHIPYRCADAFIDGQRDCINQLKALPTADVVEVVRCKDCIHYKDEWCEILKAETPIADGFCCYGERKCDND